MLKLTNIFITICLVLLYSAMSCSRIEDLKTEMDSLEQRIAEIESSVSSINDNAIALSIMLRDSIIIVGVSHDKNSYILTLNDGTEIKITDGLNIKAIVPVIGIDKDGDWVISMDGGSTFEKLNDSERPSPGDAATPQIKVNKEGYWEISYDDGLTWTTINNADGKPISAVDGKDVAGVNTYFTEISYNEGDDFIRFTLVDGRIITIPVVSDFYFELERYEDYTEIHRDELLNFSVRSSGLADIAFNVPDGWRVSLADNVLSVRSSDTAENGEYEIAIIAVSTKGYTKYIKLLFTVVDFNLLDFSYAGYKYGEIAPPEIQTLDYTIYNVTDYGAIADDGQSDREAFLKTLKAALNVQSEIDDNGDIVFNHRESAKAIIYFPEGEFILHSKDDNEEGISRSIIIRSGDLILKGAGRDKTVISMTAPMNPRNPQAMYSSPDMIQIKHNSSVNTTNTHVTAAATKGAFTIEVNSTVNIKLDSWVCLHVNNNNSEFVAKEVAPYTPDANWDIVINGVEVIEYHKIKSKTSNTVTFYEPIMHEVDGTMGWELKSYPHYENVGIEDLTFKGNAKDDFVHHGSWEDDGAYKPVSISRVTDSWIRRVGFESVSEACSIINSSNVSAYDIIMKGNRGHASVRSQASSRVLIAATKDLTSNGAGNFHGVGVSRHSIGTVLWRNQWGDDSCFESHATQPRATLIDCCKGGWHRGHQGGDSNLAPHHLADLTIWNFEATKIGETGIFPWWSEAWWRILPPTIIGFRSGNALTFNWEQTKIISSMDKQPSPESLYEYQLAKRLKSVPAWLNALK